MIFKFHILKPKTHTKNKVFFWRFVFVYVAFFIALMCLISRVAWLQIINSKKLIQEGNLRSLRTEYIPSKRGMIKDRNGHILAITIETNSIWVNAKELNKNSNIFLDKKWKELSNLLSISFDQLKLFISSKKNKRFVYLARQLSPFLTECIRELKLPYLHLLEESRRYYPSSQITSDLLGITNIDGQGIEGIEKSFNKYLMGIPGKRIVRKDLCGHVVDDISYVRNHSAHDIYLSIDERLQFILHHELSNAIFLNKAESATAILIDVHTGEILAMTSASSFNPNDFSIRSKIDLRNRAVSDIFEPGSTVKPIVIMAALQKGIVNRHSVIITKPYYINNHEIKDIINYDKLSIAGILQKSSNVGASLLALSIPVPDLVNTYSKFGLGQPTNLGLPGESSGVFPINHNLSTIERATFSFGYGLMVTPLQLARTYATIGSYGVAHPLSIIKVKSPVKGERIFPEDLVKTVLRMMETVALPGGGGTQAAIKGYRIAIKTGTTKKLGLNGKYTNHYIAYTAGVAPASRPRFSLVVVVNNPTSGKYYGGSVSAPIFGAMMNKVLSIMNVTPDAIPTVNNELIKNDKIRVKVKNGKKSNRA